VVATWLTRRWTAVYTSGLPEGDLWARRAEIESDVWEHVAFDRQTAEKSIDTGFEILMRMLLGIPSDLLWRHSTRAAAKRAAPIPRTGDGKVINREVFATTAAALTVAIGLFLIVNAFGSARGEDWLFFGPAEVLTGALLVAGVFVTNRSPRVGTSMIIVGAVGAALAHYWMIAATVPIALMIILGSLARGRGRSHREQHA
jgi:hypothetical protein